MVKVPKALSLSVMEATEKDLASGLTWKDKETLTPAHLTLGL